MNSLPSCKGERTRELRSTAYSPNPAKVSRKARRSPPPLLPNARCYPAAVFTTSAACPLREG